MHDYQDFLDVLNEHIGPIDGDEPKARKRLRILKAASQLFAAQGYRKTSVDEVAAAAGVAKGTVYSYFGGKVDLLVAAVALEKRESLGVMAKVLDHSRPAAERMHDYIEAVLVLPSTMPITTALMRGDQELAAVMAELPPALVQRSTDQQRDFLGGLIGEVAAPHRFTPGELRDRAAVIGGLTFLSTQLHAEHVRGGLSLKRYAELLADIVVGGLRSEKGNDA